MDALRSGSVIHWKGGLRKSLRPYLLWWSLITVSRVVAWASTAVRWMREARRDKAQTPSSMLTPSRPERTMKVAQDWYMASVRVKNSGRVKKPVH